MISPSQILARANGVGYSVMAAAWVWNCPRPRASWVQDLWVFGFIIRSPSWARTWWWFISMQLAPLLCKGCKPCKSRVLRTTNLHFLLTTRLSLLLNVLQVFHRDCSARLWSFEVPISRPYSLQLIFIFSSENKSCLVFFISACSTSMSVWRATICYSWSADSYGIVRRIVSQFWVDMVAK